MLYLTGSALKREAEAFRIRLANYKGLGPYKAHSNGWTQISLNYNFQDEAITLTAKEIAPSARLILVGGGRLPPSPPAEKATAA
jgi:hypothetical protein